MRYIFFFCPPGHYVFSLALLMLPGLSTSADEGKNTTDVFASAAIHELMVRTNTYQQSNPRMKPNDRNWERGTWYTGVMAAYQATRDRRFLDQALAWGKQHRWQVGTEQQGANRLFCVETWTELYFETGDKAKIEPAIAWLDTSAPNSPAGAKVWYLEGGRRYADSLYGAPALAMLAKATGDKKYLRYMDAFWKDVSEEIFDKEESLYYRDNRFIAQKSPAGKKVFWSRGNGWVMGGIVRVLQYLRKEEPSRAKYLEQFKAMSAAIAKRQGADGMWRPNLDDAEHVPFPESSGTGFFCYALAWGVNQGILERAAYEPVVRKAWKALAGIVSPEGKVQWGQPVGDRPANVKETLTHEYVTGTFLLAASEVYKLVGGKPLEPSTPRPQTPPTGWIKPGQSILPPQAIQEGHPLRAKIDAVLKRQRNTEPWKPTGLSREDYLKVVLGQVQGLRKYVDARGALADPVDKRIFYGPPCYAHCVATLAASGLKLDPELLESGLRAMDFSVDCLAAGKGAFVEHHPDFYIYPVMLALAHFEKTQPAPCLENWRKKLASIKAAQTYQTYNQAHNNWTLVHTAGEFLRAGRDMVSEDYVEHALQIQKEHITPLGMYLEHGSPFAYDSFSRYFLTGMLHLGYQGTEHDFYRDACWRGAWTSLMIQSPFGEMPTGYRSAHHIWNEAELAAIYEIYANQYARAGKLDEAGAFKRGARLALASIQQWIRPDGTGYIVKNRFPIQAKHGYESYSSHANYNLLACSMLATAWQFADDSIQEKPAPADLGGFVISIPQFNMVIANGAGVYVQYMTCGNQVYNPTGIIRIHLRGGHPQLGPSDGIVNKSSKPGQIHALTVGPAWRSAEGAEIRLAELAKPNIGQVEVLEESTGRVVVRVQSELKNLKFQQTLYLADNALRVEDQVDSPSPGNLRLYYPALIFDGQIKSELTIQGNQATLHANGRGNVIRVLEPEGIQIQHPDQKFSHRNGIAEPLLADVAGRKIVYLIAPYKP